jgi:hypothetical protein
MGEGDVGVVQMAGIFDNETGGLVVTDVAPNLPVQPPNVVTNPATNITAVSATLNGNLTSKGTASNVYTYFEYWSSPVLHTFTDGMSHNMTQTGVFSDTISNLRVNTTYTYRAYANGMDGMTIGQNQTFATGLAPVAAGKIAYVSRTDGQDEIFIMNADGSKQTRLTYYDG